MFSDSEKLKGPETDAIILIDADDTTFNPVSFQLYYVGSSRARIRLDIVAILDDDHVTVKR